MNIVLLARSLALLLLSGLLTNCASYVTPGAAVHMADFDRADIAGAAAHQPSPVFPARLVLARVQAPDYRSYSEQPVASGRFSLVATRTLLDEASLQQLQAWPSLASFTPLNPLLLPPRLDELDDLRLAAARLQADVLVIVTIDTCFQVMGRNVGPLGLLSLGLVPDRDARVDATASALFVDVRTGFVYGSADATATATGLANVWSSSATIDRKRLEAESAAFEGLVDEAGTTWRGIVDRYGPMSGALGSPGFDLPTSGSDRMSWRASMASGPAGTVG